LAHILELSNSADTVGEGFGLEWLTGWKQGTTPWQGINLPAGQSLPVCVLFGEDSSSSLFFVEPPSKQNDNTLTRARSPRLGTHLRSVWVTARQVGGKRNSPHHWGRRRCWLDPYPACPPIDWSDSDLNEFATGDQGVMSGTGSQLCHRSHKAVRSAIEGDRGSRSQLYCRINRFR
jgi:hypothetical protein